MWLWESHSCRRIPVKCPGESVSQMQMTQIIKGRDFSLDIDEKFYKLLFCVVAMHEYICTFAMFTTVIYSELLIIVNFAPKFLPIILWKINTIGFLFIYVWNESCSLKPRIQVTPNHSASYTICPKFIKKVLKLPQNLVFKMAAIFGGGGIIWKFIHVPHKIMPKLSTFKW